MPYEFVGCVLWNFHVGVIAVVLVVVVVVVCCFFCQAEDGIRDLVRSRGLGDVYKRQAQELRDHPVDRLPKLVRSSDPIFLKPGGKVGRDPVSYTHLTLPTSDLV